MTWHARARFVAWVTVVVVGSWGIWSVRDQNHQLAEVVAEQDHQADVDRARACVASWEGRQGVRSLIDGLITASGGTDPARAAQFRADMNERLPDPACDLEAAQLRVAEADKET